MHFVKSLNDISRNFWFLDFFRETIFKAKSHAAVKVILGKYCEFTPKSENICFKGNMTDCVKSSDGFFLWSGTWKNQVLLLNQTFFVVFLY